MANVLRTLLFDGQVSLTVADTTALCLTGIDRHGYTQGRAFVFAKSLSAMVFLSSCLKGDNGEISLSIKNDGGEIAVSGNRKLYIRGYAENERADGAVAGAQQRAFDDNTALTIIRDDGYSRPFVGSCAFPQSGEIDEGFEEYYRISEQLPTRIKTVADLETEEKFCGVVALQPLPFADEKTLEKVYATDLQTLLDEVQKKGVERAVEELFGKDTAVWEPREAVYQCNCSREYLQRLLVSLGELQMREIIREDGKLHIHCHYCNSDYDFTDKDADEIFAKEKLKNE